MRLLRILPIVFGLIILGGCLSEASNPVGSMPDQASATHDAFSALDAEHVGKNNNIRTTECQIGFDLLLDDVSTNKVRSDGLGAYHDGVDRVMVATGSGPGFRFDTNGSQKLEASNDRRRVTLDFSGTAAEDNVGFAASLRGVDMRFVKSDGGLDLCSLGNPDDATDARSNTGQVPIGIRFLTASGDDHGLRYGCTESTGPAAEPALVTRTGAFTWTLESTYACLRNDGVMLEDNLTMPFFITITDQNAP